MMIKELIKIANDLDKRGLIKEADVLDSIVRVAKTNESAYENITERFTITGKEGGKRESLVVQFIRMRGDRQSISRQNDSETKSYRANNKDIQYQTLHSKTPDYKSLENTPYTMELVVKQVESGQTVGKKVYRHTGLTMSSEIKEKYEEARKGLLTLDEKEQKLDSLV
jgi:hypothetical protein